MRPTDLDPALSFCTHLMYGYAGIQPDTYKMVPLNENLDVDKLHQNYRALTNYKSKYPGLKVLLSVGGDADVEEVQKYNLLVSYEIGYFYKWITIFLKKKTDWLSAVISSKRHHIYDEYYVIDKYVIDKNLSPTSDRAIMVLKVVKTFWTRPYAR